MEPIKAANLALRFLLELAALVAFGYWGFTTVNGTAGKILLGIGVPIAVAVVWGVFVSPKALVVLPSPAKIVLGLLILELAAGALLLAGQPAVGIAFGVIVLFNAALLLIWEQ
jgi:hypothetical protein